MITLISNSNPLQEIGLKSLSSYLTSFNIPCQTIYLNKVSIMPEELIEQTIKIIDQSLLVGFSMMSKDKNVFLPLIDRVRQNNIPVIAGGIHPTALPEETLNYCDFVCIGEGEEPLRILYSSLESGSNNFTIPNIAYRQWGKIIINPSTSTVKSLDSLPLPDYSLKNSYIYRAGSKKIEKIPDDTNERGKFFNNQRGFLFYAQRGCPFSCTYCSNSLYHELIKNQDNKWWRMSSVDRIKEELSLHLKNLPFIKHVAINDDDFLARPIEELREISTFLKNELGVTFTINAIPSCATYEKIKILADNGLKQISFGVQSGSTKILNTVYKRHVTPSQIIEASKIMSLFEAQSISADYGFILDNPYDDDNDWRDSLRLWLAISPPKTLSLYSLEFFPGTALAKRALVEGKIKKLSDEFSKDYRKDIKYSYPNSLFILNQKPLPQFLNNFLMTDFMVRSPITAPIRLIISYRYPYTIAIRIYNKLKSIIKKNLK